MSPFRHLANLAVVILLGMAGLTLGAAEADHNPATAYTTKVMALLRGNCLSCHNPEKKKAIQASLKQSPGQQGAPSLPPSDAVARIRPVRPTNILVTAPQLLADTFILLDETSPLH